MGAGIRRRLCFGYRTAVLRQDKLELSDPTLIELYSNAKKKIRTCVSEGHNLTEE